MAALRVALVCFSALTVLFLFAFGPAAVASASSVPLDPNEAYATFCQTSFAVSTAVDGSFSTGTNGWAIFPNVATDQVAVFETVADVDGKDLTFTLHTLHSSPGHNLGKYRISVTNSDRSTFGEGLECGNADPEGTATWTVFDPSSAVSANGQTLTIQPGGSILASGTNPASDVVTITGISSATPLTGIRLEVLTDPSLPSNGPGRFSNGNFVLTELEVAAADADLSITKTADPNNVSAGEEVTYTITVSNAGPDQATNVTVEDILAEGLGFVSATPSQGSCSETDGTVTCDLGTIDMNADASVELVVETLAPGVYENTATASSDQIDADGAAAAAPAVVAAGSDIPALDEWALTMLAIILAMAGFLAVRR